MRRLTAREFSDLRFKIGTSSRHRGRRCFPYAFTQRGGEIKSNLPKT
jgi:hypothetical protein